MKDRCSALEIVFRWIGSINRVEAIMNTTLRHFSAFPMAFTRFRMAEQPCQLVSGTLIEYATRHSKNPQTEVLDE
jgi:hypothetical protein